MSSVEKKVGLGYIKSFDGIRGYAIITVLICHAAYGFYGGWIGVDLFFALSGYLITSLLINEFETTNGVSFKNFYIRRALRLFPTLILGIFVANVLWSYANPPNEANRLIASFGAFFYIINVLKGEFTGNLSHLWSLSVEEHFYLFWPLLLTLLILKTTERKALIWTGALVLLAIFFKIVTVQFENQWKWDYFQIRQTRFTFCKIDGILMGAFLAIILSKKKNVWNFTNARYASLLIGISLFLILVVMPFIKEEGGAYKNGGFIISNILCLFLIFMAIKRPEDKLLTNKIIEWMGKRSYGIYVYHFPVFIALERLRISGSLTSLGMITILRVAASLTLAALSYKYVEIPILKLKNRFSSHKA